jgi:hypothetical protein
MSGVDANYGLIEDQEPLVSLKIERVINKILEHLGLWQANQTPPPKPKSTEIQIDYSDSQLPFEETFDQDFGTSADYSPV